MRLQDYEHNLSVNNERVTEVAKELSGITSDIGLGFRQCHIRAITPHEEDDLLTEMEEAIRLVRQARRDLSVAKSALQTQSNMAKALSACRTMKSLTPPQE